MWCRGLTQNQQIEQQQLSNVESTSATHNGNVEPLVEDVQMDSLSHSAKQDVMHVISLAESDTSHVQEPVACDDDEFDHFEEVQER